MSSSLALLTEHLELRPLPVPAAALLPEDREAAAGAVEAALDAEWPDPNLLGVLRRHADAPPELERFGVWVMIERDRRTVVGDIGFHGPPDETGRVEIGYSVVPSRRHRGYATEAASALVAWARSQHSVHVIVAGCDPGNEPSIRTLERVGFQRTGVVNGEIRWRYGGLVGAV